MKFLIDVDIPVKLLKTLSHRGFDSVRVPSGSSDKDVAELSLRENRILITLDKDFLNGTLYPPSKFNIVKVQIHPPDAEAIVTAFQKLLNSIPASDFRGLIILLTSGHIRIPE